MAKVKGGAALRARREELQKTQAELAALMGWSPNEISDYEGDRKVPSLKRAIALEKRIGLPAEVWT